MNKTPNPHQAAVKGPCLCLKPDLWSVCPFWWFHSSHTDLPTASQLGHTVPTLVLCTGRHLKPFPAGLCMAGSSGIQGSSPAPQLRTCLFWSSFPTSLSLSFTPVLWSSKHFTLPNEMMYLLISYLFIASPSASSMRPGVSCPLP